MGVLVNAKIYCPTPGDAEKKLSWFVLCAVCWGPSLGGVACARMWVICAFVLNTLEVEVRTAGGCLFCVVLGVHDINISPPQISCLEYRVILATLSIVVIDEGNIQMNIASQIQNKLKHVRNSLFGRRMHRNQYIRRKRFLRCTINIHL